MYVLQPHRHPSRVVSGGQPAHGAAPAAGAGLPTACRAAPPALGQGRAGILASIKAEVKRILSTRVDPDLNEEVLAFESNQIITLDPTRDRRFSELHAEVKNGEADVQAFLSMPMRCLPDNSQLLHSCDSIPAAYSRSWRSCERRTATCWWTSSAICSRRPTGGCEALDSHCMADLPFVTPALVVLWARRHAP